MTESIVLQSGDVAAFSKLSPFESRSDMDLAIRAWLLDHKHLLTITEEKLVSHVSQLSYKFKGVFFCKHATLADQLDLSVKTIQRCLKRLRDLGLLSVYETRTAIKQKTAKGKGNPKGRGHNVYVINAIETDRLIEHVQSSVQSVESSRPSAEKPDTPRVQAEKKANDALFPYAKFSKRVLNTLVQKKRVPQSELSLSDLVGHWVPKSFAAIASKLFNAPKEIEGAYNVVRKIVLNAGYHATEDLEYFSDRTIHAFFRKTKEYAAKHEIIEKPFAYIKGIAARIVDDHYVDPFACESISLSNNDSDFVPHTETGGKYLYNWLEERD